MYSTRTTRIKKGLLAVLLTVSSLFTSIPAHAQTDFLALGKDILIGTKEKRKAAVETFIDHGGSENIPMLTLLMRIGGAHVETQRALRALTGESLSTWREAMLYQEAHPEITPHPSYYELKLWYWDGIDTELLTLFKTPIDRDAMRIRFEEITWGGVRFDEIPALDNPEHTTAANAKYLLDTDLVFGVEVNGDARAYPQRILGWHEMVNDVVGGVPVSLAYCTLCGAGILFDTQVQGQDKPLTFGSSGLLYRSNKLMYDRQTRSLWNQFTGEPVTGSPAKSGIALKIRPIAITSWANWRRQHPNTKVLSLETGFFRDYDSGAAYQAYFDSPDLIFPTRADQSLLKQKDQVYGIRTTAGAKAWPIDAFIEEPVINDQVGIESVVLIGDAKTQTVRAYQRGDAQFSDAVFSGDRFQLKGPGGVWELSENALIGPNDERLPRMSGHVAYWFAWDGYLGAESELYERSE